MIYLFWDLQNDSPWILGENGEFYFYGEDIVAIDQGLESGRYWTKLNKMQDLTPLNVWDRFDFFSEENNDWIPWGEATEEEVRTVRKAAHDPDWMDTF